MHEASDNKPFVSEYDIVLQLFRCIGKWRFIEAQASGLIDSHRQTIIGFENQVFEPLGMPISKDDAPSYTPGFDEMDAMYADLAQMIVSDKEQLIGHSIQGKNVIKLGKWTVLYKHLSYQIPLALSSKHVIGLRTGSSDRKVFNIFWNIVPQTDQTDIMILLDAGGINNVFGTNTVEKCWRTHTSCDLAILETVESAMASTEEWYIKPSVYNSLSDEKKVNCYSHRILSLVEVRTKSWTKIRIFGYRVNGNHSGSGSHLAPGRKEVKVSAAPRLRRP